MNVLPYFRDDQLGPGLVGAESFDEFKQEFLYRYWGQINPNSVRARHITETDYVVDIWNRRWPEHMNFAYKSNSWGLRGQEITKEVDASFWGCSQTWGLGNPEPLRWSDQLSQAMGWTRTNNWGVCGISCEDIASTYMGASLHTTSKYHVVLFPDIHRKNIPYVHDQPQSNRIGYYMMTVSRVEPKLPDHRFFGKVRTVAMDGEDYTRLSSLILCDEFKYQVMIMARWAQLHNHTLILASWNELTHNALSLMAKQTKLFLTCDYQTKTDIARDGAHIGISTHTAWARELERVIKDHSQR